MGIDIIHARYHISKIKYDNNTSLYYYDITVDDPTDLIKRRITDEGNSYYGVIPNQKVNISSLDFTGVNDGIKYKVYGYPITFMNTNGQTFTFGDTNRIPIYPSVFCTLENTVPAFDINDLSNAHNGNSIFPLIYTYIDVPIFKESQTKDIELYKTTGEFPNALNYESLVNDTKSYQLDLNLQKNNWDATKNEYSIYQYSRSGHFSSNYPIYITAFETIEGTSTWGGITYTTSLHRFYVKNSIGKSNQISATNLVNISNPLGVIHTDAPIPYELYANQFQRQPWIDQNTRIPRTGQKYGGGGDHLTSGSIVDSITGQDIPSFWLEDSNFLQNYKEYLNQGQKDPDDIHTFYLNNKSYEAKVAYYGNEKIKKVYQGDTLVWDFN